MTEPEGAPPARNRWLSEAVGRSVSYDDRWAAMARAGQGIHGEADLVEDLALGVGPPLNTEGGHRSAVSVLDAGCGTGRVAIELARRGFDVVGVDLDADMLARAREKEPELAWVNGDLASIDLGRRFDLVAAAGNVMIFLAPGSEAAVLATLARHLRPGGALVAGFSLEAGRLDLASYDAMAASVGLGLVQRWSSWEREPFADGNYAVSVHRRV